jgi:predicted amidohydrolase YtcJ
MMDLGGRTLLPGFFDAHGHVFFGGLQALSANVLAPPDGNVTDMASLTQSVREWMKANAEAIKKTNLIIGFGYDPATLAEHRHPTREDLDAISTDVPIVMVHQSGHFFAVNSRALEIGGITAATPDPEGGVIRREKGSKEPNGVLEETAGFPLLFKLLGQVGAEGSEAFFRAGTQMWARYGYTTAQDGRSSPGTVKLIQKMADRGELKIDVVAYPDVLIDREFIKKNVRRDYVNRGGCQARD